MGRWTQFEEDAYRLPEGMKRVGYDADTQIYTFRDREGALYQGEPGADYGTLTPMAGIPGASRPGAFESDDPQNTAAVKAESGASTFHDILPANLITAAKAPIDTPSLSSSTSPVSPNNGDKPSPREQFVDAVRRSALPKMQGVVHNLRRSMTTRRKDRQTEEGKGLLH